MIDVGQYSCGDLFGIETVNTPEIPLMNLRFVKKHHFEDDKGYGIYFFRFNDELLYAGSYCGSSGVCLLYTSPSPRDRTRSRMPSSA